MLPVPSYFLPSIAQVSDSSVMELLVTVRYFSLLSVVIPSLRGGRRKQRPRGRQRRIRSKSAPAVLRSPRRGKRKQWDEDAMLAALEAVRSGCSIKQAALEHGVPRTTLYDRHIREDHCEFGCNYAPRFFFWRESAD